MARPTNSIAKVELPGESTQRPIVPYAVSVDTNNTAQAVLPAISSDDTIAIGSIIADEYITGDLPYIYAKGDYCKKDGFLYRATGTTSGTWDATKWEKVDIASQLNLFQYGIYTQDSYGYSRVSTAVALKPNFAIYSADDHEDYLFRIWSREGTGGAYTNYSTNFYPGRITLNGNDVVTVLQVPSSFEWTNGTTVGPTGSLKNSEGTELVSFAAIPSASATQSGVVTTGAQSFAGNKTFNDVVITNQDFRVRVGNDVTSYDMDTVTRVKISGHSGTTYQYNYPSKSGTFAMTSDLPQIDDLTEL